ncbi:MAG: DUF72 domain-containing protein [Balneolaceae bacterium]|nr:DUF72 domain-containing protein [Balneolaceae bacterium]
MPYENMVKGWLKKAHDNFSYSVKGSRQITHYNKMQDVEEHLSKFLERIKKLEEALGTIFWQFPPRFKKNVARLEGFLDQLPDAFTYAFEFRHTSWLDDDVYDMLKQKNAAIVWQSSSMFPDDCTPTANFIYIRFYGLEGDYKYSYTPEDLRPWAKMVQKHMKRTRCIPLF